MPACIRQSRSANCFSITIFGNTTYTLQNIFEPIAPLPSVISPPIHPHQLIVPMPSKTISPFFEPGAPPPTLPLLTCQTDLSYIPLRSATITACEELLPRSETPKAKLHGSPAPSRGRSSSPYVKPVSKVKVLFAAPASPPDDDDARSQSSASSALTNVSSDAPSRSVSRSPSPADSSHDLIQKPDGEAGRPGRGGYNLQKTLNWHPKTFQKLQVCISLFS